MKGVILKFALWALCAFFVSTAGASEYVDPKMDLEAQESTEEGAETEGDEAEAESDAREVSPWHGVAPEVKYELDRQLQDTGLMFSPYDPGEARPSNGWYRSFPQQGAPFIFVQEEAGEDEESDDEDEGEKEDEGEEEDCRTPPN